MPSRSQILVNKPLLMLVSGRRLCRYHPLEEIVRLSCKHGVDFVQLREKDLSSADLLGLGKQLNRITRRYRTKLLINDRLDVALLSSADGVHSPADGIPVKYVKNYSNLICGKSTHSLQEAIRAEEQGYSYIVFGPVFSTPSKVKYGPPLGLEMLREVCTNVSIPVLAIGGMTQGRALKCIQVGASGIAVQRAILRSDNVVETVRSFVRFARSGATKQSHR